MTHMLQERGCIYHVQEISLPPPLGLRETTLGSRGPDLLRLSSTSRLSCKDER